jgi:hypothetical protein
VEQHDRRIGRVARLVRHDPVAVPPEELDHAGILRSRLTSSVVETGPERVPA